MTPEFSTTLTLPDATATDRLARGLAPHLRAGDALLLSGPIGAGKSHFARALIRDRLAALDRMEDVPSPTFTLVQVYDLDAVELWHCDLYRLGHPDEALELGLEDALQDAICLIEWPERLGKSRPRDALHLDLQPLDTGRTARLRGPARWAPILAAATKDAFHAAH
ncbi:tRNA (adenosine(37)-N6)-threonylcarbamoyltransferase complex ATPase subunit type 1 TsaE [Brevirhabdus sp.]|uniref:tRNA (adenosine(37)-N6)-threonylcarbamoyltransferase complex ATPase subunit type 1 TsaE n=1 Tax=Brevirhabdus sp. TaxID=2004514 RepID=UPI004058F236